MALSLTTRRKQQTLCAKWSTQQQHLVQHHSTDATATNTNLFRHHQHHANYLNPSLWKQKSLAENLHLNKKTILTSYTGRPYLSRGLSIGRSNDTQRSSFPQQVVKKHAVGKNERDNLKTGVLMKKNTATVGKSDSVGGGSAYFFRNPRRVQAWSSTSSILKTLDKELAQLNGVVGADKDVKVSKELPDTGDNVKANKPKVDSQAASDDHSSHSNRKQIISEVSKVNLSIVLSHAVDTAKEENDCVLTDRDFEEEDTDELTSNNGNGVSSYNKTNNNKTENSSNSLKTPSNTRPIISAQKRRSLYRNSKLAANLASNNNSNNTASSNSFVQNTHNVNACPSLNIQKRAPLVRAMSAPVHTFDETTKNSATLLNTKRKSRRRKLNIRNASCDKSSCNLLTANDFTSDAKSTLNRKVLTRSKSVAPDVVTLVSLISSEGSDSEKEDNSLTPNSSHNDSSNTRAPCLRKTGKSVSFQENYPPTFQFASKEYAHMLRRGSIASLAQRIKSNRPPTAPAASIYHKTQKLYSEMTDTNTETTEETKCNLEDIKNSVNKTITETMSSKPIEEEYEFPEYVHSFKERECWKLFIKMSTKGVNITYDTILRGMLTPTEFRQLQKQREIEEAKALKAAHMSLASEPSKKAPTPIERLKESLLKN